MKKEPWRIVVGIAAIAFIVYTWVKKDVAAQFAAMPGEEMLPMLITSVAVTAAKVALLAGAVLLVKWLVSKLQARK